MLEQKTTVQGYEDSRAATRWYQEGIANGWLAPMDSASTKRGETPNGPPSTMNPMTQSPPLGSMGRPAIRAAQGLAASGVGSINAVDTDYEAGALHTMAKDPNKRWSRRDILTILRAEQARHTPVVSSGDQYAADPGRRRAIADLIQIFENLE